MAASPPTGTPPRPDRLATEPLPQIPDVGRQSEDPSTVFSHYRTGLSHHRTELSEHRTDLSEFRTDLSTNRTEMSMRRTGMSIQRTRMSADRTLMSELRTSLSLIGFGFTLYQVFQKLLDANMIERASAPRNFGAALIVLGIIIMAGGIWRHIQFAVELRRTRVKLVEEGLIHGGVSYPISVSLVVSVLLMILGLIAIVSMAFD